MFWMKNHNCSGVTVYFICTQTFRFFLLWPCQLKPALTVLFTSDKMVGRIGKGADKCDIQNGSGELCCILSHCTATAPSFWRLICKYTHLFTTKISEVFLNPVTLMPMTFYYPWDVYVQQLVYWQWVLI